jgi:multidomain signaling protein FimX
LETIAVKSKSDIDLIRLIVIEESANDAEVILNSLRKARYPIRPRHVEDGEDLQGALTEQEWDLIISVTKVGNPEMGEFTVEEVCELVNATKQDIPVIVLTDDINNSKEVASILNSGAKQVVPAGNDTFLQTMVGRELDNLTTRRKRKHLEQLYKESQKHNKLLLESSRDAIAYVHDGMHIYANPSYLEMFGYKSMEELEGTPIMDLVAITDQPKLKDFMRDFMADDKEEEREIDFEGLKASNKRFRLKMEVSQAIYDSERCVQVIVRDQTENEESAKLKHQLKEVSRRDMLTGLLNRVHFMELLDKSLAKAMESRVRSVVFYLTLDGLATMGVGGADPVIQNIAKTLLKLSEGGTLARFSDNAFTLLMVDKDLKFASDLAEKFCKTVENIVTEVGKQSVITTCSIGIAPVLAAAAGAQDVVNDAHSACLSVSKRGGNGFEIFKPKSNDEKGGAKFSDIAKLIETAKEENRLSLRYQPIVSLRGETQEIYEVFLRMVDTSGESVPTGSLFSAAEQANLSVQLDKWVLEEAIKILTKQQKQGHQTHLFIKLADQTINDDTLLFIKKLLREHKLPGERLIIELGESVAISQVKLAKAFVSTLKSFGCQAALEHFGTGLNSATTLKHVPVDYVKIDSSFSKGLSTNVENQQAVKDMVKVAHESGKKTIAEAVEDANSLTVLWSSEMDYAQGHYIQEPLEGLDFDFSDE